MDIYGMDIFEQCMYIPAFSVFVLQFYVLSVYKIRNSKHEIRNKPEKKENLNFQNNV